MARLWFKYGQDMVEGTGALSFARHSRVAHCLLLLAVTAALTLPSLGTHSLWDIDCQGLNAEAAREMLVRGNWITPSFNGELRTAKPALLYWLQMASYLAFGVNEWAAPFPSVLAAWASVLLTYALARRMFDAGTGLLAGLVLASSIEFSLLAHAATPDAVLLLCTMLTFYLFWRGAADGRRTWFVPTRAAAGLAVLAKGPVGILLPARSWTLFPVERSVATVGRPAAAGRRVGGCARGAAMVRGGDGGNPGRVHPRLLGDAQPAPFPAADGGPQRPPLLPCRGRAGPVCALVRLLGGDALVCVARVAVPPRRQPDFAAARRIVCCSAGSRHTWCSSPSLRPSCRTTCCPLSGIGHSHRPHAGSMDRRTHPIRGLGRAASAIGIALIGLVTSLGLLVAGGACASVRQVADARRPGAVGMAGSRPHGGGHGCVRVPPV